MSVKILCLALLGLVLLEACVSAGPLDFLKSLGPYPLTASVKDDTVYGKMVKLSTDILGPMLTEMILSFLEIPNNIYRYLFEKEHRN